LSEFLPGYEAPDWKGMVAPKNTPPEIIDKLNKEINAGLADPKLRARFAELSSPVMPGSPADFGKLIAQETEKWAKGGQVRGHQGGLNDHTFITK
jgi:tripartite-type tricarboxylate transporter receptor subunit TctC